VSQPTVRERIDERLRLLQLYEIFLRYGSDMAFDRGMIGSMRRGLQGWFYQTEVEPLSTPEKVRLMLQELGPTYVKLGQIVSSQSDSLPLEWATELARLQSHVQPFPVEEAREVIAAELGAPPEKVYETFDPVPLAAASLGQVHRATLDQGRQVIVKIQRPNVESRVHSDLLILGRVARFAELRSATAQASGVQSVIEEFGSALFLELDYRIEAYNARRLARNLESVPGVAVPCVIRELSRQRVLTAEFVHGVEATDRDVLVAAGLDPEEIADNAVRAVIKMVLVDGFFHADPHPGNVLVNLDNGVVTFIDTGMVGELGFRQRLRLVGLLYTFNKGDPQALAQSLRSLSQPFRETDAGAFDADFSRRIGPLMDVAPGEMLDLDDVLAASLDLLRNHGYRLDPQLSLALKALTQAEAFTRVLYPPGHTSGFSTKALRMTRELMGESITEERVTEFAKRQLTYVAGEALQYLPSLQEATGLWLDQYRKGRFEVKLDMSDLEPRLRDLDNIARSMSLGLIVAGVLIASAIAANAPQTGDLHTFRDAALVICIAALAVAAVLIVILAWRSLRGRSAR
jgi:ubiquinone biosynthesis protein